MKTKLLDLYIAHFILPRKPRSHDIKGAPYRIGQRVRILNNPNKDETFDRKLVGKVGEIVHFEYDGGCGQSYLGDPMIGVKLASGKRDEFWKEELELIS